MLSLRTVEMQHKWKGRESVPCRMIWFSADKRKQWNRYEDEAADAVVVFIVEACMHGGNTSHGVDAGWMRAGQRVAWPWQHVA